MYFGFTYSTLILQNILNTWGFLSFDEFPLFAHKGSAYFATSFAVSDEEAAEQGRPSLSSGD